MPVEPVDPLQYAPPARGTGAARPLGMLGGGVITSALAVLGVYLLERFEQEDPFGWHALFLLPVGSLLVAVVAASGFLFAVRLTHVRPAVDWPPPPRGSWC